MPLRAVRLEDELRALDLLVMSAAKSRIHRQGAVDRHTHAAWTDDAARPQRAGRGSSFTAGGTRGRPDRGRAVLIDGTASSPTMNILATGFVSRDFEDKGPSPRACTTASSSPRRRRRRSRWALAAVSTTNG